MVVEYRTFYLRNLSTDGALVVTELRPIPGQPHYLVSDYGEVWSKRKGKFLTPRYSKSMTYPCVDLPGHCSYGIHRVVADAWLPNPDNLPWVHHKDNNPLNNHVSNLEWCSIKYNTNQGRSTKLTDEEVEEIKRLYSTGLYTQAELGDMFEVVKSYISMIVSGKKRNKP